jgi:hypothetical protein
VSEQRSLHVLGSNEFPEYKIGEIGEIDLWREHSLLIRYDNLTGETTSAHGELTCSIIEDFLGTGIGQAVYSAAMLHRIALDVDHPKRGDVASGLLRSYAETLPPEDWEKISRYLSDFKPLAEFADEKRVQADALLPVKPLRSSRKGQPSERQKSRLGRVNASTMEEFLKTVNIESANIMAAATLATLMHPESINDKEYYRVLREADVVYGQVAEFSSKDALGMALRNNKKRFTDSHPRHGWVYDAVGGYMNDFGGHERYTRYVNGILVRIFGKDSLSEHCIKGNTEHGIVYGVAAVNISTGGIARVIYRGKSNEGAADKVMRTAERLDVRLKKDTGIPETFMPPDVLGMTTVVEDIGTLAIVYADILRKTTMGNLGFLPGIDATKSSPHSLDGSEEFIKSFMGLFKGHKYAGENGIITKENNRGFDALRTLFRFVTQTDGAKVLLPTDMHVQTQAGRTAARTGPANHNAYDLDKTKKHTAPDSAAITVNTEALVRMETRAACMGSGIFVPSSVSRAQYFRKKIAASRKIGLH